MSEKDFYADGTLDDVEFAHFAPVESPSGSFIKAQIIVSLKPLNPGGVGSSAALAFRLELDPSQSFQAAKDAALTRVCALLHRLARETPASLAAAVDVVMKGKP